MKSAERHTTMFLHSITLSVGCHGSDDALHTTGFRNDLLIGTAARQILERPTRANFKNGGLRITP